MPSYISTNLSPESKERIHRYLWYTYGPAISVGLARCRTYSATCHHVTACTIAMKLIHSQSSIRFLSRHQQCSEHEASPTFHCFTYLPNAPFTLICEPFTTQIDPLLSYEQSLAATMKDPNHRSRYPTQPRRQHHHTCLPPLPSPRLRRLDPRRPPPWRLPH